MALAQVAVPGCLVAGTYVAEDVPNYWEARHGTATAPIVLESVDGPGRAALPPINAFDVRHLYVLGEPSPASSTPSIANGATTSCSGT